MDQKEKVLEIVREKGVVRASDIEEAGLFGNYPYKCTLSKNGPRNQAGKIVAGKNEALTIKKGPELHRPGLALPYLSFSSSAKL